MTASTDYYCSGLWVFGSHDYH